MKKSTKFLSIALMFLGLSTFAQAPVVDFSWTPASPCQGATVAITGSITSGTVTAWGYSLTGATAATVAAQSPVVTFTASGTQTIILVALNGITPSAPVTKTIDVKPYPTMTVTSSSPVVCTTGSAVITATGAATYSWMPGGAVTNTIAVTNVTANMTYSVVGTGTNGCAWTKTVTQWVANLAVTSTTNMLCSGSSATLNAGYGTSYSWAPGSQTTQAIVVSPTVTTSYTVTNAQCSLTASFTQSVTTCVGITEISADARSFGLYPNPATNAVTLEFNNNSVKNISLLDLTGRVVLNTSVSDEKTTLNISNLAKGIYYVRIQTNNKVEVAKIVKD